jgi:site-specific recombinase XerD
LTNLSYTLSKHHQHFKKYINQAIKSGISVKNPYNDFKIIKADAYSNFCTDEELERLENLTFNVDDRKEKFMECCRDMYLFSCYTGLRYSDTEKITAKHFQNSKEGLMLDYQANKTKKFGVKYLFILFGGKPERIALKYMPKNDDTLFKGVENQRVNEILKVLAKRARINKPLRFKDSRDTFGTIMISKAPINVVRDELQHGIISTTQKYLHLTPEMKKQELNKIKW